MNKEELHKIIKALSDGFLYKKIEGDLYSKIVESLISLNLDIVDSELEEFSEFLAQYKSKPDMLELYSDKALRKEIKKIFGLKEKDYFRS